MVDKLISTGIIGYFTFALSLMAAVDYRWFAGYLCIFFCLSVIVCRYFRAEITADIKRSTQQLLSGETKDRTIFYFLIVLLLSAVYWYAYYPGGFNLDAYGQWYQAHGYSPYNDWHPFVSTLLIQLVVSFVDDFAFYILIQIILFSATEAFMLRALQKAGIPAKFLVVTAILTGLNPAVGLNTVCMVKDVQYSILLILIMQGAFRIVESEGRVLHNNAFLFSLGSILALSALVRHNGVLFVVPFLLLLLFGYKACAKRICILGLTVLVIVMTIKGPVAGKLKVEPHNNVTGELVGIPMAIMANALVHDTENVPEEVHAFLNTIAADEEWNAHYFTGEWDSCKWEFSKADLLKNEPLEKILYLTWETMRACPQAAYDSFRENTKIVWEAVQTPLYWIPEVYIEENDLGIIPEPVPAMNTLCRRITEISLFPVIRGFFWNNGMQCLVMLTIFLFLPAEKRLKESILVLPLLAYTLGTMLLLAGPNQRYFYCNAVLYIPVSLMMLRGYHR